MDIAEVTVKGREEIARVRKGEERRADISRVTKNERENIEIARVK